MSLLPMRLSRSLAALLLDTWLFDVLVGMALVAAALKGLPSVDGGTLAFLLMVRFGT